MTYDDYGSEMGFGLILAVQRVVSKGPKTVTWILHSWDSFCAWHPMVCSKQTELRKQIEDIIMNHHKYTEFPDPLVDAMRKAVPWQMVISSPDGSS